MNLKLLAVLTTAVLATAATARAEHAMYSCIGADGAAMLTNVPTGAKCEKLFDYQAPAEPAPVAANPAPAPAAAAPVAVAQAAPPVAPASAPPRDKAKKPTDAAADGAADGFGRRAAELRQAQRRDAAVQETAAAYANGQPAAVQNPAVNRRYLMTTRAAFVTSNGTKP
jgi:type IV secretory pathway VirB10-like protein